MNNVLSFNKSIEDKRYTTAKGLQQIFIGLGRSTIDDWAQIEHGKLKHRLQLREVSEWLKVQS